MDRALCLYLLSNFATSNKKISMKTKMIVVVVLAAMCVLPLSAQVKVGVEGGMNLSHYLVSGSDGYKPHWHSYPDGWSLTVLSIGGDCGLRDRKALDVNVRFVLVAE